MEPLDPNKLLAGIRAVQSRQQNFRFRGQNVAGNFRDGYCVRSPDCEEAQAEGQSGGIPITPTGACCNESSPCSITTEDGCEGVYLGDGTTCSPDPCLGACCDGETCTEETQSDCEEIVGGVWQGFGTDCDPNPCGVTGACCNDGVCTQQTEDDCEFGGGFFFGEGFPCEPNPCLGCGCGFLFTYADGDVPYHGTYYRRLIQPNIGGVDPYCGGDPFYGELPTEFGPGTLYGIKTVRVGSCGADCSGEQVTTYTYNTELCTNNAPTCEGTIVCGDTTYECGDSMPGFLYTVTEVSDVIGICGICCSCFGCFEDITPVECGQIGGVFESGLQGAGFTCDALGHPLGRCCQYDDTNTFVDCAIIAECGCQPECTFEGWTMVWTEGDLSCGDCPASP